MSTNKAVRLLLGNVAPVAHISVPDQPGETIRTSRGEVGNTITYVSMRPGYDDEEAAQLAVSTMNDPVMSMIGRRLSGADLRFATGLRDVEDLWQLGHSDDPPEWVSCPDDPDFARVVADHFSSGDHKVHVGWAPGFRVEDTRVLLGGVPGDMLDQMPKAAISEIENETLRGFVARLAAGEPPRPPIAGGLMTNLGRDNGIRALYDTTRTSILGPFNTVSLSANASAESASTTTLPGRITTAGGGLAPAAGTYAHTAATSTFTISRTATANGTDSLPVTIAKIGLDDASANCGHEKLLSATAALAASGDNLACTFTGTWTPS